jgi:hypothetical protein
MPCACAQMQQQQMYLPAGGNRRLNAHSFSASESLTLASCSGLVSMLQSMFIVLSGILPKCYVASSVKNSLISLRHLIRCGSCASRYKYAQTPLQS